MTDHGGRRLLEERVRQACLREIAHEWASANWHFLGERLRAPGFTLIESRWGRWDPLTRTIGLAEELIAGYGWGAVVETLKHEMAHQYVDEVLRFHDALPHGEAFRRACERLVVDPRAKGDPRLLLAHPEGEGASEDPRLRRVRKLLALADSSCRHEAEAALAKANELLLRHSIERAEVDRERGYTHAVLGPPMRRRSRHVSRLAGLLASHFFVEVIWVSHYDVATLKRGKVLEISGTPEHVELAEFAWGELQRSAEELWRRHKERHSIRGDRDRRHFVEGVIAGFERKLEAERERCRREYDLVWLGDPELERFFRRRHPRVRTERYSCTVGGSAYSAGQRAGRDLRLTRAVRTSGGEGGRLLPG